MADLEGERCRNVNGKSLCNSKIEQRSGPNIAITKQGEEKQTSANRQKTAGSMTTTEYCAKLQEWMWQYYGGCVHWQGWMAMSTYPFPYYPPQAGSEAPTVPLWGMGQSSSDARNWYNNQFNFPVPPYFATSPNPGGQTGEVTPGTTPVSNERPLPQQQQNGNVQQAGREYTIPSPLQRFLAEMLDFFILFFIKATIILSIMHMSGMKDISKFAMHFIVEEIDEDTSMEELQKMMLVALVYRILVCFYEIICIWGAGGATPGKFLLGLRVVTCDTSVLVRPNRVLVVPASNVTLSASTVRALNKNFSIAFFFPAFITLLFFQHNRTVYDIVAGTIVVKRSRAR
ncbi:protein FAM8A1-like [Anguilla anguilla]|uniref:RDD domain-containing protein n=1 Tax=Anguilla anguilla TaxID=7936 RepID=A0A9D3S6H4_ANGAN|nr:protein FAM8A1-like [Anguilla anguilla]KAG5856755.1 hypothetical protein ANANG_G00011240 [Anguilla anguilla]